MQDKLDILKKRGDKMKEADIWKLFSGITKGVQAMHQHDPPYAHRFVGLKGIQA